MEKCPKCGFQPVDGLDVCPECGFPLTEIPTDKHGDIAWEKIADLPIGKIQEALGDQEATVEKFQESAKEPEEKEKLNLKEDVAVNDEMDQEKHEDPIIDAEETEVDSSLNKENLELNDEFAHLKDTNPILAQYILTHKYGKTIEKLVEEEFDDDHTDFVETNVVKKTNEPSVEEVESSGNSPLAPPDKIQNVKEINGESNLADLKNTIPTESENLLDNEDDSKIKEKASVLETSNLEIVDETETKPETIVIQPETASIEEISSSIPEKEESVIINDHDNSTEETPIAISADETDLDDFRMEESAEVKGDYGKEEQLEENNHTYPGFEQKSPKKRMRYLILASLIFLTVGAGGFYYHQQQVAEKAAEAQRVAKVEKENQAIEKLNVEISEFYTNNNQDFLKQDKVYSDTSQLTKEANKYKDNKNYKKLEQKIEELNAKKDKIRDVDFLFVSAAINGNQLNQDLKLKNDTPVNLTINGNSPLDQILKKGVEEATKQYDQLQNSKKAVNDLVLAKNENQEITREQFDNAKRQVDEVKNQDLIQNERTELDKINEELTAKEAEKKAEEERKAQEEAQKAEAERKAQEEAAQVQQSSQVQSSGSAVASGDAYAWAPGVQEKVLQTCLDRGYMVPGGYYLTPVRVVNGEGYYDLYATSPGPRFQNLSSSDFPLYLVTINCKTGYFRGNGNDQTIR